MILVRRLIHRTVPVNDVKNNITDALSKALFRVLLSRQDLPLTLGKGKKHLYTSEHLMDKMAA